MVAPRSAAANAVDPVGTGPFKFLAWRRGDSLTLTRNADYWGVPARLQRATFQFIADPSAAYAALMAGDIDAFSNYPAPESIAQFQCRPALRVFVGPPRARPCSSLNNRRPPLDDIRVRRAISYALDRAASSTAPCTASVRPSAVISRRRIRPTWISPARYPHDPAKARELLRGGRASDGFAVVLKLPPPSYARRSGEIVAAQLGAVGIHVRIENLEWAQWLDQVFTRHDFDMSIVSHARADGLRHLCARRLLLRLLEPTVQGADRGVGRQPSMPAGGGNCSVSSSASWQRMR